jgi:signal peptidase I
MIKAAVVVVLGAAAAAAAWWFLAPPALGGRTSLAIVDGSSMYPTFERNDLVFIRPSSTYRVGDVVAYHSTLLRRVVLHRVVALHDGRYTFKGDNNHFLDPEQPTSGAFIGKRWFRVPAAGRLATFLHTPWIAAVLAALLVLAWGLSGAPEPEPTRAPG